jgi:single-stranded-DNA-specific exonuclease
VPETLKAFAAKPYDYADVRAVADGLSLSEPVAVTLVRRGYRTPELARDFLAANDSHPSSAFDSIEAIVAQVREAIAAEKRITVHGDFDVDGVCATTIMVSTLRALGAECDWLIPDRIGDGYGVSATNVEKLAKRGTQLLITVDCGITALDEVALARQLGIETIVTDHHQAGDALPDCLILHPEISNYPFASLCGTAVAWKLACALREGSGMGSPGTPRVSAPGDPMPDPSNDADLDLVALATVADVVPLVGENRALVKRGLAEMRRVRRVGLRALIEAAKCEPTRIDEGDLAFRLAPRINAAGRLYRADAGVELLLTNDEARATEIAAELGRANSERRAREREVDTAAEAARRELPDQLREGMALVLAGEDWHPGVVGIVASRLVERHHRPVVVVSLDGEGGGRGSGRSIPGFDLHAALAACAEHLESFGGHRAAAGLSLRAENLMAFRAAFAAHAATVLGPDDLRRTERIDAMVGGVGLGLELAEELGQLAPFGMGNPGVRLMVPSARVSDVRTMGEGKHARFSLHSGAHRALGVAFGRSSLGVEGDDPVDAAIRLEVNHWNGSVEPRVVLNELYPLADEDLEQGTAPLHSCSCGEAEWWARFEAERSRDLGAAQGGGWSSLCRIAAPARPGDRERTVPGGNASVTVTIAELVSSGAGVLAVCADASRRAALASGAGGLARFNGGAARVSCHRCGGEAVLSLSTRAGGGLALTDYEALGHASSLAAEFEHVVLVDPPRGAGDRARVARLPAGPTVGFLHPLWTAAEVEFSGSVVAEQLASRAAVTAVFRSLREAGEGSGEELRQALAGSGSHPLGPEAAGRCFRVLSELGLVAGEPRGGAGVVGTVSSDGTDLERSPAFRAYREDHSEAQTYLERPKQP